MGYRYENQCCDCAVPGYPCTGEHKSVKVYFCDRCKRDYSKDDLCEFYGDMVCVNCLVKEFGKVGKNARNKDKQ